MPTPQESRTGYHRLDARQNVKDDLLRTPVEFEPRKRGDNLFLWTVFLLLLVGVSMVCWIGSYVIFNRPELPVSYRLLRKLHKIDLPQRFPVNAAPTGEFLTPEKLYAKYNALAPSALRELNKTLERNYLRNYPPGSQSVSYVTGRFTILNSYQLRPTDFIPTGVVILGVSTEQPKLLIEHIYSANSSVAPLVKENLQTGMDVDFRRTYDLTAVLHVTKLATGHIQLTAVPINYGSYAFTGASGGFSLEPPLELHVAAGWPIIRQERRDEADKAYAAYRQKNGLSPSLFIRRTADSSKPGTTALKGVDVPLPESTPAGAATPPPARTVVATAATPAPAKGSPKTTPKPAATVAKASPPPAPMVTPIPVAKAVAVEDSAANARKGTLAAAAPALKALPPSSSVGTLQPFLAGPQAPATGAVAASRSWRTYAAGKAPSGKNLRVNDIASYAQKIGQSGEPTYYLNGQFVVRAVGENRMKGVKNAVLRSTANSNVRVIVEYPTEVAAPAEGSEVSRDEDRPYQITAVRQVADGTLNVYAREITE